MKIFIIMLVLIVSIYLVFWGLAITKYKFITFTDIDLNHNKILSLSEINYILNSKVRYRCYIDENKYKYSNTLPNKNVYKKVIMEIFSEKDGLPIKEILIKESMD